MPALRPDLALIVPTLDAAGGAERFLMDLASGLARRGHRVDLVVLRSRVRADAFCYRSELDERVHLVDLQAPRLRTGIARLWQYLGRVRPPVAMATLDIANLISVVINLLAGCPARMFVREAITPTVQRERLASFENRHVIPALIRLLYPLAAGVFAPSQGVADDLAKNFGVRGVKVITNPYPSYLEAQSCEACPHPWLEEGREFPVVMGAGHFDQQKDFPTLLAAFASLRKVRPARLILLGEGPDRDALRAQVRDLGITDDVVMPGFAANPFAWLARADLFVLSSLYEGMPNMLVQALACGCPAVATDCPSGPREIIQSTNGRLVPVADVVGMAAAMAEVLDLHLDRSAVRASVAHLAPDAAYARYADAMGLRQVQA